MDDKPHKLFERWGWNYMPVTLNGCGCIGLFTLLFITVILSVSYLGEFTGDLLAGIVGATILVPAAIAFIRFADRHS